METLRTHAVYRTYKDAHNGLSRVETKQPKTSRKRKKFRPRFGKKTLHGVCT